MGMMLPHFKDCKTRKKDENENTNEKCLTHKRKLNNLHEYLNRQKNGKSHQSSSVMESGREDKDGSFTARLKYITG